MGIEAYPELSDVTVKIATKVPGLAAEEVEKQITTPLERSLSGTTDLSSIRSNSTFALSLITMVFKEGAKDYFTRDRVLDRISQTSLPTGIQPSLDPLSGAGGEIYRYTLESDTKKLMELSEIQRWVVIPALEQVPGVESVDSFGGITKEFQLLLDLQKMYQNGVVLNDVVNAINNNNANAGGGRISRGDQSYIVQAIGQIGTLDDLANVVVTQTNGVPVTVADLGQLQFGHQEREGILGKNNNPDTIEGIVGMTKYKNPSQVLKVLHAKLNELQKKLMPMDIKIVPYMDRDNLVELTIDKVRDTVIHGILLVCLVLILFIGNIRTALVVTVTIPTALAFVFIMMNATHMPANLFSLGAIDFGVIVNGAIVIMEAILRRREEQPGQNLSVEDTLKATSHVTRPILFATLIIISAYLPLFGFEGAEGTLFTPMAYTVSYALLGALICALTVVPGLAYTVLRKPQKSFTNHPLIWLTKRYRIVLAQMLTRPKRSYLIGIVILAMVTWLGITAGREFLPELDEGALWLQVDMPSGLSLEKANSMASEFRKSLLQHPEVAFVVTQLGRSAEGTDAWPPSHMEVPVGLKPYAQWPTKETKDQFIAKLTAQFTAMPGYTIGISQPIMDNVNDLIGGAHSPLVLRVFGDDLTEDRRIGNKIVAILKSIKGTASASIVQQPPIPQMKVKVDRRQLARYGINISDVTSLIQIGLGGAPVSVIYDGKRIYNATVRFPKANKSSIESLGNLFLNSSTGAKILLSQLASIEYKTGESSIAHEHNDRELTIQIENRGRDLISYLREAQQRINKEVHYNAEQIHLEWAGQFERQEQAQKRFITILFIVLLLMSTFLFVQFQKVRRCLLILGVVPIATLGGLITLHLTGQTLNVATAVGFIALFGVSVQNAIILIANIQRISDGNESLFKSVVDGATEQLRPVLMTATVASVGMLPAALATGVGTDVQRGLATVVVGGLLVSIALTLFILPTYYYRLERFIKHDDKIGSWRIK
jgi:cobalt-zinc-cadmium resistance protein CzcA